MPASSSKASLVDERGDDAVEHMTRRSIKVMNVENKEVSDATESTSRLFDRRFQDAP